MMKIPILAVLLILLVISRPGVAEFCKWVDENGVVHYAETCPENAAGTAIETQTPPSQAQVNEANKRLVQLLEERKARREVEVHKAEQKAADKQ